MLKSDYSTVILTWRAATWWRNWAGGQRRTRFAFGGRGHEGVLETQILGDQVRIGRNYVSLVAGQRVDVLCKNVRHISMGIIFTFRDICSFMYVVQ
jgi:hypothetical protein